MFVGDWFVAGLMAWKGPGEGRLAATEKRRKDGGRQMAGYLSIIGYWDRNWVDETKVVAAVAAVAASGQGSAAENRHVQACAFGLLLMKFGLEWKNGRTRKCWTRVTSVAWLMVNGCWLMVDD